MENKENVGYSEPQIFYPIGNEITMFIKSNYIYLNGLPIEFRVFNREGDYKILLKIERTNEK